MTNFRHFSSLITLGTLLICSCNVNEVLEAIPGSEDYYAGHIDAVAWVWEHESLYPGAEFHTQFHEKFISFPMTEYARGAMDAYTMTMRSWGTE